MKCKYGLWNGLTSGVLFVGAMASIIGSLWIYRNDPQLGTFIGLWAPTLLLVSDKFGKCEENS